MTSSTIAECLYRDPGKIDQVAEDPGPPYLFFDIYPFDRGATPDFDEAAKTDADGDGDGDVRGGILKATDGTAYGYTGWFISNWKRVHGLRGAYHFLQFLQDPVKQADFYLKTVELAGGFTADTIMPIVDVEDGGERHPNRQASPQQIIDCTSRWALRVKAVTGRRVMLYGRGSMRDHRISDKMGCDCVWNPSYTQSMVTNGLVTVNDHPGPWKVDDIVFWQYGGDGDGDNSKTKLPLSIRGLGKIDMSVYVDGARKPTMQSLRARAI